MNVRVRIVKGLAGVMDGVPLSSLVPGFVYELNNHIGGQLLEMCAAKPVRAADPETIKSVEDLDIAWVAGGIHILQSDTAHDRPDHRKKTR
jgi:hypothetical protein